MLSWKQAFETAGKIFLYSVAWWIIGIVLIIIGISGIGYSAVSNYLYPTAFSPISAIFGLIFIIIGSFLIFFGTTATYIKFRTDLVVKEVMTRIIRYGKRTEDTQLPNMKYCPECENQTPIESSFCINCGNKL